LHLQEPESDAAAAATELAVEDVNNVDESKVGPTKKRIVDLETSMRYMKSKGTLFDNQCPVPRPITD